MPLSLTRGGALVNLRDQKEERGGEAPSNAAGATGGAPLLRARLPPLDGGRQEEGETYQW